MLSQMKWTRRGLAALLVVALLLCVAWAKGKPPKPGHEDPPEPSPPPVTYMITWLGTLGGLTSRLMDMNDFGDVVGSSDTAAGERHGFLNEAQPDGNRTMTDLNELIPDDNAFDGWEIRQANAINNQGQIAGHARRTDMPNVYYRYTPGATNPLEDLGTNDGRIFDMNNDGTIVGVQGGYAFRYRYGTGMGMEFLNNLIDPASGWSLYRATAISDRGWIVGDGALDGSEEHVFLFMPATEGEPYATVVDLAAGWIAYDISEAGHVVGEGDGGFLYTPLDGMIDLAPGRKEGAKPHGVNDSGHVVGMYSVFKEGSTMSLALPPTYEFLNLDDLIDPVANDLEHLTRWYASGVNGSQDSTRINNPLPGEAFGQIGGSSSIDSNDLEAYILTPVPPAEE